MGIHGKRLLNIMKGKRNGFALVAKMLKATKVESKKKYNRKKEKNVNINKE